MLCKAPLIPQFRQSTSLRILFSVEVTLKAVASASEKMRAYPTRVSSTSGSSDPHANTSSVGEQGRYRKAIAGLTASVLGDM